MLYKIFYPESNILSQILFLVMRILGEPLQAVQVICRWFDGV